MQIHVCARCEGCGYVTGWSRWEVAWSKWAGGDAERSVLDASPCPDCGGTGALIEMDVREPDVLRLPSRRGLPVRNRYARHVSQVLHAQHARREPA